MSMQTVKNQLEKIEAEAANKMHDKVFLPALKAEFVKLCRKNPKVDRLAIGYGWGGVLYFTDGSAIGSTEAPSKFKYLLELADLAADTVGNMDDIKRSDVL